MRRILAGIGRIIALTFMSLSWPAGAADTTVDLLYVLGPVRGVTPKYDHDAKYLDFVNPNAPKGGELKLIDIGGFDNFNAFIPRGNPAIGMGLTYDTLLIQLPGEPLASYGLVAESIELPRDLSSVTFNLRANARFHDGKPMTAEDVVWSFDTLKTRGRPNFRFYYANVAKAEALSPRKVKFTFTGARSLELPSIIGQLPVLPKHYWANRDFEKVTLEPPLGSGPYRVKDFEANRFVVLERVPDYWARDLFFHVGRYNFDRIRFDSYRDTTVVLEAFKAGAYDFRDEISSRDWAVGYDFPAVRAGQVIKEEVPSSRVVSMQAFAFNTRRDKFSDPRVRRAIGYAFDFEWSNKNLFHNLYSRPKSFFGNTGFASTALPDVAELKLLEPLRDKIPPEVFTKIYEPPKTDGSGNLRENLQVATKLLGEAGWRIQGGKLIGPDGKSLEIEFLIVQPEFDRIISPMIRNLERLGITAKIRVADSAQYQNRLREHDFDMIVSSWPHLDWPGNEQREFWHSQSADSSAGRNLVGVKNPAVDVLVDKVITAESKQDLITATRALDRVLLWNYYIVPQFVRNGDWIAYWNKFGRPEKNPSDGVDRFSWWVDAAKEAALKNQATGKSP